jgi:hypothetical protein
MEKRKFPSSGLDLKDVVGSDAKLEAFINSKQVDPDLRTVPKIGEKTEDDLKKAKIRNVIQLIGKFAEFEFDFEKCVKWIRSTVTFNQSKMIVVVILYKLDQIGLVVPPAPDNWRTL